jgi:hypothetical protein
MLAAINLAIELAHKKNKTKALWNI